MTDKRMLRMQVTMVAAMTGFVSISTVVGILSIVLDQLGGLLPKNYHSFSKQCEFGKLDELTCRCFYRSFQEQCEQRGYDAPKCGLALKAHWGKISEQGKKDSIKAVWLLALAPLLVGLLVPTCGVVGAQFDIRGMVVVFGTGSLVWATVLICHCVTWKHWTGHNWYLFLVPVMWLVCAAEAFRLQSAQVEEFHKRRLSLPRDSLASVESPPDLQPRGSALSVQSQTAEHPRPSVSDHSQLDWPPRSSVASAPLQVRDSLASDHSQLGLPSRLSLASGHSQARGSVASVHSQVKSPPERQSWASVHSHKSRTSKTSRPSMQLQRDSQPLQEDLGESGTYGTAG